MFFLIKLLHNRSKTVWFNVICLFLPNLFYILDIVIRMIKQKMFALIFFLAWADLSDLCFYGHIFEYRKNRVK